THLGGLREHDDGTLTDAARSASLARVGAGIHLRDLNPALERAGQALPNMGGYDAQTISGVVSTSTHGSGLRWGPFPDLVRSLDVVVSGGEALRIEPEDGPSDPAFPLDGPWRLLRDDEAFHDANFGNAPLGLTSPV